MGILFSFLFRFLVTNGRFEQMIAKTSALVLERQRMQEKLSAVLTNLEPGSSGESGFYTTFFPDDEKAPSVVFCFNAGIDPDPYYSHAVIGRLYLTKEGQLRLSYWPRSKEGYRTEILMRNVFDLEWQFLGRKTVASSELAKQTQWAWLNQWPKNQGSIPQIVRLRMWCGIDKKKQREPNLQFAFIQPAQEPIAMGEP